MEPATESNGQLEDGCSVESPLVWLRSPAVIDEHLSRGLREKEGSRCHCWRTGSRKETRNLDNDEPRCRPAALHLRHSREHCKYLELSHCINHFPQSTNPRCWRWRRHMWKEDQLSCVNLIFFSRFIVWKSPLFFDSQIFFGLSHFAFFIHSYSCQVNLALVKRSFVI